MHVHVLALYDSNVVCFYFSITCYLTIWKNLALYFTNYVFISVSFVHCVIAARKFIVSK